MTTNAIAQTKVEMVQAKQAELENQLGAVIAELTGMVPTDERFAGLAQAMLDAKSKLALIPDELKQAIKADNKEALAIVDTSMIAGIKELLSALNVESLIGEKVVRFQFFDELPATSPDANDAKPACIIYNPVTKIKYGSKADNSGKEAGEKTPSKRPIYVRGDEKLYATELVNAYGTIEEKTKGEGNKWPHTHAPKVAEREGFVKVMPE